MKAAAPVRLTILAGEFPYPPIHGGRADTWSRIKALHHAGVKIQLICWFSPHWGGEPKAEDLQVVREVVQDLMVLPISLGPKALLRRLCLLPWYPSHAAARAPDADQWLELKARVGAFKPLGIWQDNLWAGVAAVRLSQTLKLPRWVRSHNMEHRYMDAQRRLASDRATRLKLWLTCLGLKRYELRNLKTAQCVFDISMDDMARWHQMGVTRQQWLPPIANMPALDDADLNAPTLPAGSALFVGNLHTPNNVHGLLWFLKEVWPLVRQLNPQAEITVAGSNPHEQVMAVIEATQGAHLLANPAQVWPLYRQAAALINPVLSGSGVNIKTIEMLQMDCPIISTSVGVAGLPKEVREALIVADQAQDFAGALAQALNGLIKTDASVRESARHRFRPEAMTGLVKTLAGDHS